jgi:hypothetical protein
MSREVEIEEELPSGNVGGNGWKPSSPTGSKSDQLASELKVLKLQQKIAKLKKKLKSKNPKRQEVSSSSSNEEVDDSCSTSDESTKAKRSKGNKKHGSKPSYNTISFNYDSLPSNYAFTSMHVGKPPCFDGANYAKWCHAMKVHLMSLNPSIWKVVCTCVEFSEKGETPDYNQLQQIHYNAQASNVLLSSLEKDEYDHVDGLEKASEIWETL